MSNKPNLYRRMLRSYQRCAVAQEDQVLAIVRDCAVGLQTGAVDGQPNGNVNRYSAIEYPHIIASANSSFTYQHA